MVLNFVFAVSRVSQALIRQSGQGIISECANNPIVKTKVMRVTSAPNLAFQYVIHLVSPRTPNKITEHVLEALIATEKNLKCRSIAIPAIGTGKLRTVYIFCVDAEFLMCFIINHTA